MAKRRPQTLGGLPLDLNVPQSQWDELAKRCEGESDRGVALVAAAYVETLLGLALRERLVDRPRVAELFQPMGPLESFSAKIGVAFGVGLLSEWDARDLDLIKDIRNDFAHSVEEITFADDRIRDLCSRFTFRFPARSDRETFLTAVGFAAHVAIGLSRPPRLTPIPTWSEPDTRFVNIAVPARYSRAEAPRPKRGGTKRPTRKP